MYITVLKIIYMLRIFSKLGTHVRLAFEPFHVIITIIISVVWQQNNKHLRPQEALGILDASIKR